VNTKDDILKVFVYTINVNGVQKNFFSNIFLRFTQERPIGLE